MVPGQPPHGPQFVEGVGLAEMVAEVSCGLRSGGVARDGVGPGAVYAQ
jgi:hypothetical protein